MFAELFNLETDALLPPDGNDTEPPQDRESKPNGREFFCIGVKAGRFENFFFAFAYEQKNVRAQLCNK